MNTREPKTCCAMRRKVALKIDRVFGESECGIPDSVMADFHDFDQESGVDGLSLAVALTVRYCPWCGTLRTPEIEGRNTLSVLPRHPD